MPKQKLHDLVEPEAMEWGPVTRPANQPSEIRLLKMDRAAKARAMLSAMGGAQTDERVGWTESLLRALGMRKATVQQIADKLDDKEAPVPDTQIPKADHGAAAPGQMPPPADGAKSPEVAALEARIKELEAMLAQMKSETVAKADRAALLVSLKKSIPASMYPQFDAMKDDELKGLVAKLAKPEGAPEDALAQMVQKLDQEHRATVQKLADMEAAESVRKIEGEYEKIPTAKAAAPAIARIRKSCPEEAKQLEQVMKALAEQVKVGDLFGARGGRGAPATGGARAQIEAKAAELRKADPNLSREQAVSRVVKQHPELRRQETEEAEA